MNTTRRVCITVRGRLTSRLAASFEGLTRVRGTGTTELVGDVADQAQLHGILSRIRDLGLDLQAVLLTDLPAHPSA
jgi:hypothetical protein